MYAPLWVTDFPMFEFHDEDGRYYSMHHPFTSPVDEDLELLERAVEGGETNLLAQIRTKAYDPVINGVEMASGSIRIHRRDVQRLVFKALGMTTEEAREDLVSFWMHSNTARRHTAASPPASTV